MRCIFHLWLQCWFRERASYPVESAYAFFERANVLSEATRALRPEQARECGCRPSDLRSISLMAERFCANVSEKGASPRIQNDVQHYLRVSAQHHLRVTPQSFRRAVSAPIVFCGQAGLHSRKQTWQQRCYRQVTNVFSACAYGEIADVGWCSPVLPKFRRW